MAPAGWGPDPRSGGRAEGGALGRAWIGPQSRARAMSSATGRVRLAGPGSGLRRRAGFSAPGGFRCRRPGAGGRTPRGPSWPPGNHRNGSFCGSGRWLVPGVACESFPPPAIGPGAPAPETRNRPRRPVSLLTPHCSSDQVQAVVQRPLLGLPEEHNGRSAALLVASLSRRAAGIPRLARSWTRARTSAYRCTVFGAMVVKMT